MCVRERASCIKYIKYLPDLGAYATCAGNRTILLSLVLLSYLCQNLSLLMYYKEFGFGIWKKVWAQDKGV